MKRPWDKNKLDVFKEQKVGPWARAEEKRKQCQGKCKSIMVMSLTFFSPQYAMEKH